MAESTSQQTKQPDNSSSETDKIRKPIFGNFFKRVVAAILLAPLCIWSVVQGGVAFLIVTGICAIIASFEWSFMVSREQVQWKRLLLSAIMSISALTAIYAGSSGIQMVLAISVFAAGLMWVLGQGFKIHPLSLAFGAVYTSLPFGAFVFLRESSENSQLMMFAIFAIVWGTDTAGYLAGKAYGGPLLAPKNSPNKTWTGAIGGVIYAGLAGAAVANLTQSPLWLWLVWSVFLSIAAQQGDLLESMFKRKFGIKDMSNVIPGHGGLLDRLDGLMAAITVAAFFSLFFPSLIQKLLGE